MPSYRDPYYEQRYKEWRKYSQQIPWWQVPRGSSEEARRLKDREVEEYLRSINGGYSKDVADEINRRMDKKRDEYQSRERSPTPSTVHYPSEPSEADAYDSDAPLSPPSSPRPSDPFSHAKFISATITLLRRDVALYNMYEFDKYEKWKEYMLSGKPWPPKAPVHPGKIRDGDLANNVGIGKRKREREEVIETVEQEPAMKKFRLLATRSRQSKTNNITKKILPARQILTRSQARLIPDFYELSESGRARIAVDSCSVKNRKNSGRRLRVLEKR